MTVKPGDLGNALYNTGYIVLKFDSFRKFAPIAQWIEQLPSKQ